MTAGQILKAIKRLDPKEQLAVIRFAYQPDAKRRLSGEELSELAERMVKATDPAEEAIICEAMIRGFCSVSAGRAGPRAGNRRADAKRSRNRRSAKRT